MKKNILLIFMTLALLFLLIINISNREKISQLELEVANQDKRIQLVEEKLTLKEREFQASKKLANIWAARAYGLGYSHSKQ